MLQDSLRNLALILSISALPFCVKGPNTEQENILFHLWAGKIGNNRSRVDVSVKGTSQNGRTGVWLFDTDILLSKEAQIQMSMANFKVIEVEPSNWTIKCIMKTNDYK